MARADGKLTLSDLKAMGLTAAIIKLLPPPELISRMGPPIKVWSQEVVQNVLSSPEGQRLTARAEAKRRGTVASREARRKNEIEKAIQDIKVDKLSLSLIINEAEKEFQNELPVGMHTLEPIEGFGETFEPDPNDPVIRWLKLKKACSYILKYLVVFNYDWYYAGIGPDSNIYGEYRSAVLDRIAEAYPELKDECSRRKVWQR